MSDPDVESWKNISKGRIGVNKFGRDGSHSVVQELVAPGRTVLLSAKERQILNQERVYSEEVDPFLNGNLYLVSGASDTNLQENPNHMSEDDMRGLFSLRHWKQFQAALKEITSPIIMQRMLDMADAEDDLDCTVKQVDLLKRHLADLTGTSGVTEVDPVGTIGNSSMAEDEDRRTVLPMRVD